MNKSASATIVLLAAGLLLMSGCGGGKISATSPEPSASSAQGSGAVTASPPATASPSAATTPSAAQGASGRASRPGSSPQASDGGAIQVVAKPDSITVLVNKHFSLPRDYEPKDLVYPDVPFIFKEKIEKRMMRKEAAQALEQLFAGAKKDGIYLAGVSAYRSYATQTSVFNNYVKTDGEAKALTYSALPGTSEHETGLAIDVSGSDGKCAAADCFASSKEAKWLEQHAADYGFIIRYPKGKESITGYEYEPWHIRYVGTDISKTIASKGITLEEYFNAIPVSK